VHHQRDQAAAPDVRNYPNLEPTPASESNPSGSTLLIGFPPTYAFFFAIACQLAIPSGRPQWKNAHAVNARRIFVEATGMEPKP
jgi:hypothetical protein